MNNQKRNHICGCGGCSTDVGGAATGRAYNYRVAHRTNNCGTDFSTAITWDGLEFRGGAACTLVFGTCQLDLEIVKFSSVKRDSAQ